MCGAKAHVRFTPNNDRESGLPQTVVSALPPESGQVQCNEGCPRWANTGHRAYSITSSARARSDGGMARPNTFAVFRLMTNSNFVGCMTGRSAGFVP